MNLHDTVIKMIKERPKHIRLEDICNACNIKYSWLTMLLYTGIANPSVHKIERIYIFLNDGYGLFDKKPKRKAK